MTVVPDLTGILAAYRAAKRLGDLQRSISSSLVGAMDGALLGVRGPELALMQSVYESALSTGAAVAKIAAEHRAIERGLLGDPAWRAALEGIQRDAKLRAALQRSVQQTLSSLSDLHLGTLMRGWADGRAAGEQPRVSRSDVTRLVSEQVSELALAPAESAHAAGVIAEEVTAAVEAAAAQALPNHALAEGDVAVDASDTLLAALARAYAHITARLPGLSKERREKLVNLLLPILVSVVIAYGQTRSDAKDSKQVIAALHEAKGAQQRVEGHVLHIGQDVAALREAAPPTRYRTTRAVPLREDSDARAPRIGTVAAGEELAVRDRVGRWLYVQLPAQDGGRAQAGWVYHRHLVPLADQ